MKKIIWILAASLVVFYFVNAYIEKEAIRDAKKAESKNIRHATRSAVSQLISNTNAIDDWEPHLSKGKKYRFAPILTIELEKLWLKPTPILFTGSIKDIATHNQTHYTVIVERNLYNNFEHMFDTELRLSLISNKEIIDAFLAEHPDLFKEYGFNNGVAVVARITTIRTMEILGEESEIQEIRIGDGELVDIVFTGDVRI